MTPTETGFRCEPCTAKIVHAADDAECIGCDFNKEGQCTTENDAECPITAPRPKGPRGPFTVAEQSRIRARAELAAEVMREPCPDCGSKGYTWEPADRRNRIGVDVVCANEECDFGDMRLLTREGVYQVAVSGNLVAVVRQPSSAFYRLDAIVAFAVTENADHDVLTFRAGNETQVFAVEDADPVIDAITKLWGKP